MVGWIVGRMIGKMIGWMEGWMVGWMVGRVVRWMDEDGLGTMMGDKVFHSFENVPENQDYYQLLRVIGVQQSNGRTMSSMLL